MPYTSTALFISSSECSVLLLCSAWCRDESEHQENSLDSTSNIAALPSLSHKLIPRACSEGTELTESSTGGPALHKQRAMTIDGINYYINPKGTKQTSMIV